MSDLVSSVNGIFEKIAEVIDLSFFPPGAACLGAVLYWNGHSSFFSASPGQGVSSWPGWFQAGGAILGSYVLGLLCFTAGRFLRNRLFGRSTEADLLAALRGAVAGHGGATPTFTADYLARNAARPLHARMWTEVRQNEALRESYRVIQHYWVLTATYDGMAAAFVVWAGVVVHHGVLNLVGGRQPGSGAIVSSAAAAMFFLALMGACVREARRLQAAQIEELAATLAHRDSRPSA